ERENDAIPTLSNVTCHMPFHSGDAVPGEPRALLVQQPAAPGDRAPAAQSLCPTSFPPGGNAYLTRKNRRAGNPALWRLDTTGSSALAAPREPAAPAPHRATGPADRRRPD